MKRHAESDLLEVREAFSGAGLSPKLLRRAIRIELGKRSEKFARPLHRSAALRKVFKQGASLASVDDGRLRPVNLVVALVKRWESVVSSAVTKLGHDPHEVLRGLSARLIERFAVDHPEEGERPVEGFHKARRFPRHS